MNRYQIDNAASLFNSLAQAGQVAGKLAERQYSTQMTAASTKADTALNGFLTEIEQDTDYANYGQKLDEFSQSLMQDIKPSLTSPRAQRDFQTAFDGAVEKARQAVTQYADKNSRIVGQSTLLESLEQQSRSVPLPDDTHSLDYWIKNQGHRMDIMIDEAVRTGVVVEHEGINGVLPAQMKQQYRDELMYNISEKMGRTAIEQMVGMGMYEEDILYVLENAVKLDGERYDQFLEESGRVLQSQELQNLAEAFRHTNLTPEQEQKLFQNMSAELSSTMARQAKARERQYAQVESRVVDAWAGDEWFEIAKNDFEYVRQLPADDAYKWIERYNTRMANLTAEQKRLITDAEKGTSTVDYVRQLRGRVDNLRYFFDPDVAADIRKEVTENKDLTPTEIQSVYDDIAKYQTEHEEREQRRAELELTEEVNDILRAFDQDIVKLPEAESTAPFERLRERVVENELIPDSERDEMVRQIDDQLERWHENQPDVTVEEHDAALDAFNIRVDAMRFGYSEEEAKAIRAEIDSPDNPLTPAEKQQLRNSLGQHKEASLAAEAAERERAAQQAIEQADAELQNTLRQFDREILDLDKAKDDKAFDNLREDIVQDTTIPDSERDEMITQIDQAEKVWLDAREKAMTENAAAMEDRVAAEEKAQYRGKLLGYDGQLVATWRNPSEPSVQALENQILADEGLDETDTRHYLNQLKQIRSALEQQKAGALSPFETDPSKEREIQRAYYDESMSDAEFSDLLNDYMGNYVSVDDINKWKNKIGGPGNYIRQNILRNYNPEFAFNVIDSTYRSELGQELTDDERATVSREYNRALNLLTDFLNSEELQNQPKVEQQRLIQDFTDTILAVPAVRFLGFKINEVAFADNAHLRKLKDAGTDPIVVAQYEDNLKQTTQARFQREVSEDLGSYRLGVLEGEVVVRHSASGTLFKIEGGEWQVKGPEYRRWVSWTEDRMRELVGE